MDVQHLTQFVAAAEHAHFGNAAQALGISQPALSQRIRSMEEALGVRLFDRVRQRVRLTNAGAVYLVEARALLARFAAAGAHALEAHQGKRGDLVVAASSVSILVHLPPIARQFRALYPDATLRFRVASGADVRALIRNREAQLGFANVPDRETGIVSEILWSHPHRIVLPEGHPLAETSEVALAKLHGDQLIIYQRATIPEPYDQILALCNELGFHPTSIEEVATVEAAFGLVACGAGVTIVTAPWEQAFAVPGVVTRTIARAARWQLTTSACRHPDETSPLAEHFLTLARRHARRNPRSRLTKSFPRRSVEA